MSQEYRDCMSDVESLLRFVDDFSITSASSSKEASVVRADKPKEPLGNRINQTIQDENDDKQSTRVSLDSFNEKDPSTTLCSPTSHADPEAVRHWAERMREAVQAWLEEQKAVMECEKEQMEGQVESYRLAVERLQTQLRKVEEEAIDASKHYRTTIQHHVKTEEQFREIIDYQQNRIKQLEAILATEQDKTHSIAPLEETPKAADAPTQFVPWVQTPKAVANTRPASPVRVQPPSKPRLPSEIERIEAQKSSGNRRREFLENGTEVIHFSNGTKKEKLIDGSCIVYFVNGDIQTQGADQTTAYFFAQTKITKITEPNSTSCVFRFPNGQTERHWPNGRKRIEFSDGSIETVLPVPRTQPRDRTGQA